MDLNPLITMTTIVFSMRKKSFTLLKLFEETRFHINFCSPVYASQYQPQYKFIIE